MNIERNDYISKLKSYKDKKIIKVITGVRRCGKSVLLFELYYNELIKMGVKENNIICINLEDQDNINLRNRENLYDYIKSKTKNKNKYYVFIDEIQYVEGFEDLVNTLNNKNYDTYITGSNSKMLSQDIVTSLRGRSIEIKVYPLSFKEFYSYEKGDKRKAFNKFLYYGGFPFATIESNIDNKVDYLKMIESTVAIKDIIERHNIRNTTVFNAVYDFLLSNIGSVISAKKIADTLNSNGFNKITSDTVSNYINYLCDAFLFYKVYRYDIKGKNYLKTLNKYYTVDVGLRNAHMNFRQVELTHILENVVYMELIKKGFIVDIGKNREKEIDFIATNSNIKYYIQVAYSMPTKEKIEQETSSFNNINDGYEKIIITMDDDLFFTLYNGYRKINVVDFLLDDEKL